MESISVEEVMTIPSKGCSPSEPLPRRRHHRGAAHGASSGHLHQPEVRRGRDPGLHLTWLKVTGGTARMTIQPHGRRQLPDHLHRPLQPLVLPDLQSPRRDRDHRLPRRLLHPPLHQAPRRGRRQDPGSHRHRRRRRHPQPQEDQDRQGPPSRLRSRSPSSTTSARAISRPARCTTSTLIADGKLYTVHARVVRKRKSRRRPARSTASASSPR